MAIRTCENCERDIGHLEPELLWQGRAVCAECLRRLVAATQGPVMSATVVPAMEPAFRRPRKPWPLWLAIGLFALAAVPITIQFTIEMKGKLDLALGGNVEELEKMGSGGGNALVALGGLAVSVINLVGFVAAWRGWSWGAIVAAVTAVVMVYMELGGMSLTGLKPTTLYASGLVVMVAGYACLLLPPAWAYYRRCAEWRASQQ